MGNRGPEQHEADHSPNIHQICTGFFNQAYEGESDGQERYLKIVGDAELLRLHGADEHFDAVLARPRYSTVTPDGIMFWLHIINLSVDHYQRTPYLVAMEYDASRWYIKEDENQPVRPYALRQSRKVTRFLNGCYMMPAQTMDI